jgi:hypothetical protein
MEPVKMKHCLKKVPMAGVKMNTNNKLKWTVTEAVTYFKD